MRAASVDSVSRAIHRILLAAGSMGLVVAGPVAHAQDSGTTQLETVIVTASKREQDLREVPASVSAYTGEQLQELGAQSLSDYITRMPGVVFNDYQPGVSEVVIRGISATTYHEQGQTVVGYYINEIPLSEPGWPIVIPDVDTFDLERVEVLRGPQGTLFGSASLGGLVNYIAKSADPDAFDAAVQSTIGSTSDSDDMNYGIKGMVNLPLIEGKLGVRVVGLERRDAGYADNIRTGKDDTNDLTTRGARLSAVYTPAEETTLSWLTMYQETDLEDQTYVVLPTLNRDTYVPEPHKTEMLIHSLRLDQDLGFGTLTALGAVADKESRLIFDYTANYGETFLAGGPVFALGLAESQSRNIEVRLASNGENRIDWVVGGMYLESEKDSIDHLRQIGVASFITAGGDNGAVLAPEDSFDRYVVGRDDEEVALFGEVTFNITDTFAVTAGGRLFEASSDSTVGRLPGIDYPDGYSYTEGKKDDGFTPKLVGSWKPSEDFMLYASYSEGFRVGGANPNPPGLIPSGRVYDADGVKNYELGTRTTFAGGAVQLDVTAFHIDWEDIQVRLFGPAPTFYAYVTNAGGATVDGAEMSATFRAGRMFEFQTNLSYTDATVDEFVPDTFAVGGGYEEGTRLPGSSEWTWSNNLSLTFADVKFSPQLLLAHRYLSEAPVAFSGLEEKGDYHLVDLRAGVNFTDDIDLTLFVNNIFDEYGILNWPFGDFGTMAGTVTRPRTVGLTLNWAF